MKLKHLLFVLALSVVVTSASAQIAKWTFETSIPTTAGPIAPEIGAGVGSGFHSNGAAVYSNPVGNGSAESYSANFWSVGDYWQFQVSSVGYENILVSYDQTSSSTGPGLFNFAYSTDGTTFTDFAVDYGVLVNGGAPYPAWTSGSSTNAYSFSFDLSAVSAIENASTVYFRLVDSSTVSASGGAVGTAGANRIDNFTVSASAIPEPQVFALFAGGGLMLLGMIRRRQ